MRQKHLSIKEKYYVSDENGQTIFYAERPQHLARNILAMFVGVIAGIAVILAFSALASAADGVLETILISAAWILGFLAIFIVAIALSKKRHLLLYVDDTKQRQVLEIQQDRKVEFIKSTYTVTDANGTVIARFVKVYIHNLIRKKWDCFDAAGNHISVIREDSIGKAIARRLLGPMFGALRTNFIILTPQEAQLGAFNREFTILDRYVLDMRQDPARTLDRRIALGIGLMLDTGEKR